ncbi:MAG: ABC transporter permease [Filifactoraceae bacterium]
MKNKDLFLMGFKNLWRRKARSILAISGVIIGTCSIVVMLSLGIGLSAGFQAQVESYGNLHLVDVQKGYNTQPGKKEVKLDNAAIEQFKKIPGVTAVSPILFEYMKVGIGKMVANIEIIGIDPDVMQKFGYDLSEGRLLEPNDKYAIVFGNSIPQSFYNPRINFYNPNQTTLNVITDKIIITADQSYGEKNKNTDDKTKYPVYKARGVGLLSNPSDESSYQAYVNISTMIDMKRDIAKARKEASSSGGNNFTYSGSVNIPTSRNQIQYEQVKIYVEDIDKVKEIGEYLKEQGYQTYSLNDMLETMQETARMIQAVLGGIGAISLLVAALGITNTMIMSIYERTKEIGVMKVIGSNLKDIKNLFLFEAAIIGLIGGFLGLVLSYIISFIMNTFLLGIISNALGGVSGEKISIIPIWLSLLALIFSTGIGVFSGYLPAKRAMNLSALESLRNE